MKRSGTRGNRWGADVDGNVGSANLTRGVYSIEPRKIGGRDEQKIGLGWRASVALALVWGGAVCVW